MAVKILKLSRSFLKVSLSGIIKILKFRSFETGGSIFITQSLWNLHGPFNILIDKVLRNVSISNQFSSSGVN